MNQWASLLLVVIVRGIESCMICGRPFPPLLPPLPQLPDISFGLRPPFIPPMTSIIRPEIPTIFQFRFRGGCQMSPSFGLLDIDNDLVVNVTEAVGEWRYYSVSQSIQDLLSQQTSDSGFTAVESAIPPDSLVDALMALTTEQKAHITELAVRSDTLTLTRILDGIILSLPDEIQAQSYRFTHLLSDLLCYSSKIDQQKSLIESLLG